MKKILSIVLLASMLIGIIPFSANADDKGSLLPFTDVKADDWFYDAVEYSYNKGLFKGTNDEGTLFSPEKVMTRAQFATTLFRVASVDESSYAGATGFSDVPAGKWMSPAVKWAAEKGYVKGTGENKFNPTGALNRQQLATMLYRFVDESFDIGSVDDNALNAFEDSSDVAAWAKEAMIWITSVKLLNGNEKGLLVPQNNATRAQVAQILLNFNNVFEGTDSTGLVNSDLVFAINNIKYTEPKNVIFMIGDGMGFNIVEMTEHLYKDELYAGKLAMNHIPQLSTHTSYSQDNQTTDSAAGGTALATGFKTANGVIAMDPECTRDYKTTLELAAEKGKSTGIIATKSVTDATPASFTAHVNSRYEHELIARQQIEAMVDGELDLVLGGGRGYFTDGYNSDRLNRAVSAGQLYYSDNFEYSKNDELPMFGLYSSDAMDTYDEELPTLAEMTDLAIDKLSVDKNGFFLMVEGSQIDTFAHNNDLEKSAHECFEFDRAVAVVLDFIKNNPDTLLIITADHETGGLVIPEELDEVTANYYTYLTGSHSYRNVPVYAVGYGIEAIDKTNENVDLAIFVAGLLGEDDFGYKSENHNLIGSDDLTALAEANPYNSTIADDGIKISFGENGAEFAIPVELFNTSREDIKNARAIHIEFTNTSDRYVVVPSMYAGAALVDPHLEYLEPGEKQIISYILPSEGWNDYIFADVSEFGLYIAEPFFSFDPAENEIVMGDITVTNRNLDK